MIHRSSRYVNTPVYPLDGNVILETRIRYTFDQSKCTAYRFIQGDTLDCIAHRLYNKASLWWAILDNNPQYESELEIKEGDMLSIPNYDEVVSFCGV